MEHAERRARDDTLRAIIVQILVTMIQQNIEAGTANDSKDKAVTFY